MTMMSEVCNAPVEFLRAQLTPGQTVICAVSGGLDSMCLLHLVGALGYAPLVAHYHHGLRGALADRDAAFVQAHCQQTQIPCVIGYGDVAAHSEKTGQGLEEAGRALRYDFLLQLSQDNENCPILTAHHATDNAETVLFNLLRGTALRGLCGIPQINGNVLRPLLPWTRAELADYGRAHTIPFVEDETNVDETFSRNKLRHQALPVLEEINPKAIAHIYQTTQILRQEEDFLNQLAQERMPSLTNGTLTLSWESLHSPLASRMVLLGMEALCGHRRDITASHVAGVLALTSVDAPLNLPYGMRACAAKMGVILTPPPPKKRPISVGDCVPFGRWNVALTAQKTPGSLPCCAQPMNLQLRCMTGRDRLTLWEKNRSVKRRLQEQGLSNITPVLCHETEVIAVAGLGIDQLFQCKNGATPTFYITFTEKGETL